MKMDKKRELVLLQAAVKVKIRKEVSFRDIEASKREIGNLVKEPEMKRVNADSDELLELFKELTNEVYRDLTIRV
jgi:hypothetical protein